MLDSLTICATDFQLAIKLRLLFHNLRKIKLELNSPSDIKRDDTIKDLLKSCGNVEELSVGASNVSAGSFFQCIFLQNTFKSLRSLELYEVRNIDLNNLKISECGETDTKVLCLAGRFK